VTEPAPLPDRVAATMARLFPDPPARMGVSVSGGSDSTALMHLAARWAGPRGVALHVVTINHGLRPEAAAEAVQVAAQAARLALPHCILTWDGWSGQGNLQDAARRARRGLLEHWRGGIRDILLGHTMDDQAETFWLNLSRGSGVAGLAAMAERTGLRGVNPIAPTSFAGARPEGPPGGPAALWRPLLGERRAELRRWLQAQGIAWCEDPSNANPRFDRVRVRQALEQSMLPGVTVEGLAATAARMQRARAALALRAAEVADRSARVEHGDVVFGRAALAQIDEEIRATLLAHALRWVASSDYRPRAAALDRTIAAVLEGRVATLHGCLMRPGRAEIRVTREARAVAGMRIPFNGDCLWDRRWRIRGPVPDGAEVRPLSDAHPADPAHGLPRTSLAARPALWIGDTLLAVPGLDAAGWQAELQPPWGGFRDSLLSL
jgi:tRNA(Ile)-lysidine synthase